MSEGLGKNIKNTVKAAHQESTAYLQGGVRVNEAFWYHKSKEYPGQVGIHLYAMDVGTKVSEIKAGLNLYKEGLNQLAERLETDPELQDIQKVVGWSKLVYEKPKILELLGFEITERDEEKKEALAVMDREKFITRPWNKKKAEIPTSEGRDGQTNEQKN